MRYALAFLLAAVCLTTGAIATFARISFTSIAAATQPSAPPAADTVPTAEVPTPVVPTAADYARYADADKAWRERHARQYTIAELRARGDGRRTPREAMHERWVSGHRRDEGSLLDLARLLNETGRTSDAVTRYREILALRAHAN